MIKQKIVIKENPVQQKLLKYGTSGPTVEEARANMLAAKEETTTTRGGTKVPSFISGSKPARKGAQPQAQPQAQPAPNLSDFIDEGSPAVAARQPVAQPTQAKPARVAQPARIALDSWDTFYATRGLTQADVAKLDAKAQETIVDAVQVVQIQFFMNANPGFVLNLTTWTPIEDFLKKYDAPITQRNIEYACQGLNISLAPAPVVSSPAPAPPVVREPAESRKRTSYSSSIRPGQSSAASLEAEQSEGRQPVETEEQRAKRLSQTKEGLDQLRREAIPSLANARSRR
jgi:hypothetical protein